MGIKLYISRHGQSQDNANGIVGGNSELTVLGKEHAKTIADYLRNVKVDLILHSNLIRSKQTAGFIAKYHENCEIVETQEIEEILCGRFDEILLEDFKQYYTDEYKARNSDKFHWKYPDGENARGVFSKGESYEIIMEERIKPFIERIKTDYQGKNIVISGHQAINRIIIGTLLNLEKDEIPFLIIPNDVIFEIDPEDTKNIAHIVAGQRINGYTVQVKEH